MQGSRRGGQGTWQWRLSSASVPSQAACSLSPSFQLNSATPCAPAPAAPPNSPFAAPWPRQRAGRIRGGTNRHSRAALCGQAAAVHGQSALGTCAGAPPVEGKRWSETGRLGELLNGIVHCERDGPTLAVPGVDAPIPQLQYRLHASRWHPAGPSTRPTFHAGRGRGGGPVLPPVHPAVWHRCCTRPPCRVAQTDGHSCLQESSKLASHLNTLMPRGARRVPLLSRGVAVSLQNMGTCPLLIQPCRTAGKGWQHTILSLVNGFG